MNGQYWYRSINTKMVYFMTFKQIIDGTAWPTLCCDITIVYQQSLKCKILWVLCSKVLHNVVSDMLLSRYYRYQGKIIINDIQIYLHFHRFCNSNHNISSLQITKIVFYLYIICKTVVLNRVFCENCWNWILHSTFQQYIYLDSELRMHMFCCTMFGVVLSFLPHVLWLPHILQVRVTGTSVNPEVYG